LVKKIGSKCVFVGFEASGGALSNKVYLELVMNLGSPIGEQRPC
jgi:hypothetical protein